MSGGNVWNSAEELQPWLMVDLKKPHLIAYIVWTGLPGKGERAHLVKLLVKVGKLKNPDVVFIQCIYVISKLEILF